MGKQMRPQALTKRKADWVVLCESCKARIRRAEKQPRREATAVTEEDDEGDLTLLFEVASQFRVTDDDEELVAAAATAAAQTQPVPLASAATVRPSTPEPPPSEKRAPTSEARRHASLVERHAELTAQYAELATRLAEVTNVNLSLTATISKLQGQLAATGTASHDELQKRLSEYFATVAL